MSGSGAEAPPSALGPVVREERPGDEAAIARVTAAAFRDHPFSRQTEPFIVRDLRAAGALALSLVAEAGDAADGAAGGAAGPAIVGHVAFSPVEISDGTVGWFGVGPLSVAPERQRRGIGGALMREGLALLRARGAAGCVLVGRPEYYGRFGFRNAPALAFDGAPREVFLALPLGGVVPHGRVTFHPAFGAVA